ncbi:monocarboxylate transporter 12-like [Antedon mediterranea]|uniref:monocarboxylate transporter 12-like n=1 Tax=Antedon mediterranea TaxID=105859 RepID=UPI003AF7D8B9
MEWKELTTLVGILVSHLLTMGIAGPAISFFLVDFTLSLQGSSTATIGLAHSLFFGAISVFGPLAVVVTKRIGDKEGIVIGCCMVSSGLLMTSQTKAVWQLFFTHSLVTGLGFSLMATSTIFIIGHYFNGSPVYIGFLYAGSASGMLVTPIFCAEAKVYFGFRGTLLILSALSMNAMPISLFIFRKFSKKRRLKNNTEMKLTSNGIVEDVNTVETSFLNDGHTSDKTDRRDSIDDISTLHLYLKYPYLILLCTVRSLAEYAYIGFFIHFIASVIYKGISERNAAFALGSYGLGSLIGRLTAFVPGHINLMKKSTEFITSMLITGTLTIIFDYIYNVYAIIICSAAIGYFIGWYLIIFPPIVRESVCVTRFKDVYGLIILPGGVVCMFAGYVIGLIYDASGLYRLSFFIAGGIFILNAVLMIIGEVAFSLKWITKYRPPTESANKV